MIKATTLAIVSSIVLVASVVTSYFLFRKKIQRLQDQTELKDFVMKAKATVLKYTKELFATSEPDQVAV